MSSIKLRERITSSQSWIMRNRAMVMLIVVFLYALFATKSCMQQKQQQESLITSVKAKDADIVRWKDKAGIEHAKTEQISGELKTIKVIYQDKLDSITKKLDIKEKQVTDYIQIVKTTKGKFRSRIDSFFVYEVLPYDSTKNSNEDSLSPTFDHLGTVYSDKWISFVGNIEDGYLNASYSIKDSLTILGYWKRSGFLNLGKKNYYLDISSQNPNTQIENTKNFKITSIKQNKVGLGVIGGYGFGLKTGIVQPFLGLGLYYKIL